MEGDQTKHIYTFRGTHERPYSPPPTCKISTDPVPDAISRVEHRPGSCSLFPLFACLDSAMFDLSSESGSN